jgi:hypothetical protein
MKITVDTKERISALGGFFVECFKIFMACLLSVFVPQECDGKMCTVQENFLGLDPYNVFVLVVNFATLGIFFSLYVIELNREYWLIKYLDIDRTKGESSVEQYTSDSKIINGLQKHNKQYYETSLVVVGMFALNFVVSAILLGIYYYDYRTITTLLSNTLLLVGKVKSCLRLSTISYKERKGMSYYTVDHLCYNDVDDDYKPSPVDIQLEEIASPSANEIVNEVVNVDEIDVKNI